MNATGLSLAPPHRPSDSNPQLACNSSIPTAKIVPKSCFLLLVLLIFIAVAVLRFKKDFNNWHPGNDNGDQGSGSLWEESPMANSLEVCEESSGNELFTEHSVNG